jgi:hypothetical protein
MPATATLSGEFQISLPKEVREKQHWEAGQEFVFNHSRTHHDGSTSSYGRHARIAFITAFEPSSLTTRFMLYASSFPSSRARWFVSGNEWRSSMP